MVYARRLAMDESRPVFAKRSNYTRGMTWYNDVHAACELGVMTEGRIRRRSSLGETVLGRGKFWFVGPWEPHGFEIEDGPASACVFAFPMSLFTLLHHEAPRLCLPFVRPVIRASLQPGTAKDMEYAVRAAEALDGEINEGGPGRALLAQLGVLRLLAWVTRNVDEPAFRDLGASAMARVIPVISALQDHPGKGMTLEEAAQCAHLSRARFSEVFAQAMGTPFGKYALERRLQSAWSELISGEEKLAVIARKCGFHDSSHLSRQFKARFGVSPGALRPSSGPGAR